MKQIMQISLLITLPGVTACSTPPTNKQVGATAGAAVVYEISKRGK
ncbi:MAG: hypothetical protein RLZZ445_1263 [Pseudomonadota bacterium]|jgi:hypothetical protein